MAKFEEKRKALILRKKGESVKQIAKQLNVSRGTVSVWCSDISLTLKQQDLLRTRMIQGGHVGRMRGRSINIMKRQNNIASQKRHAQEILGELSHRDIMTLGLGLYWGEGSKKNERRFIFTNSDEAIVRCMIKWLYIVGIPKGDVVGQIYINEQHKDRVEIVENFWLKKLNIQKEQLRKTVLIKTHSKKYYENMNTYFGTFRLMVKKSTTLQYLTMELLGVAQSQI